MMYQLFPLLLTCVASQSFKEKDTISRYRLHYPEASWHTAHDVCETENKTLARVETFESSKIIWMVLEAVNKIFGDGTESMTSGVWIHGFFRPSNNESMQGNCRSFDPRIRINAKKAGQGDMFCLYYNMTDETLNTDDCLSSKPFLCEELKHDERNRFFNSTDLTLKNGKTDKPDSNETNENGCRDRCADKCNAYLYDQSTELCKTYTYSQMNNLLEITLPKFLQHKAILINMIDTYQESDPKPLNDWCPEVMEKINIMKKNLTVDKKKTNRYNRTLISAPDDRQSAKNLGIVGITVICLVVAVVILPDYINLINALENKRRRYKRD